MPLFVETHSINWLPHLELNEFHSPSTIGGKSSVSNARLLAHCSMSEIEDKNEENGHSTHPKRQNHVVL